MAYDAGKKMDDKSPIWNFLYHCRNAAAHGGHFKIERPRFPAKWGNLEITPALNESELFHNPFDISKRIGLLAPGYLISLLLKIEKTYFN